MAQILCITSGLTGILNASFELVSRLQAAGHTCTCASPKQVSEKVTAQGFNYVQFPEINFDPAPALPNYKGALRKLNRLFYKFRHSNTRRSQAIEGLGMKAFGKQIGTLKPDLIIVDVELHEHIMTLVTSGHKVLLLSQWFSLWNRKGLPSLQQATIPGIGFAGSPLGLKISWLQIKANRWWMFAKKNLLSGGTDRRSVLKQYAKEVGFPLSYIPENYWPGPFTYDRLPVISMTSEYLEFRHSERPNHTYVGPMVYTKRIETSSSDEMTRKIAKLIAKKEQEHQQLIYCSVSTFRSGDTAFIRKVIDAVEGQQNWVLILGLGGLLNEHFTENLPNNVHAFNYIPQLQVLASADLSINHGGIHTINECVHFEVPMLIYSGKRSDQSGCAARVHFHGLGLMADKDIDSKEQIREKITTVLSNQKFRENVVAVNERNKVYNTDHTVQQLIDRMLKEKEQI